MEDKAGPQVASPYFQHQFVSGRFYEPAMVTKRFREPADSGFARTNSQHQQASVDYQSLKPNWNANLWDWDSVMFVAKPANAGADPEHGRCPNLCSSAEILRLGTSQIRSNQLKALSPEQKGEADDILPKEPAKPFLVEKDSSSGDDAGNLTLKLGGSLYSSADDTSSARQNKRPRAGSPGSTYPMCQVDDCRADLTNAKDYHRRHKVCEAHSKASKALVGNLMQRFCQQCSRFHPLLEFDEGKRSCRRRLAGHNRRRRKTQPDDALSRGLLVAGQENGVFGNLEIVKLISILSQLQGSNPMEKPSRQLTLDRDRLVQLLSKMSSFSSSENFRGGMAGPQGFDLNVAHGMHAVDQRPDIPKANGHQSLSMTAELLAILSTLTGSSPDVLRLLLNNNLNDNLGANFKAQHQPPAAPKCQEQGITRHFQSQKANPLSTSGTPNNKTNSGAPNKVPELSLQPSLPLQLFGSCGDNNSPPNLRFNQKYFSSDSSDPMEDRSPSSSPPVVQKLFPLHSGVESKECDGKEDSIRLEASPINDRCLPFTLAKTGNRGVSQNIMSNSSYQYSESRFHVQQTGYTSSSSGSDQSPASSNSDSQERTGRIIFKLFGKDPSSFPLTLRSQILEWLSHSPSDMESYIRPGCVILSIFVSMPSTNWEQLRDDLQQRLKQLVENFNNDFWRSGRVLVQVEQQLASCKDGKVKLCKSWKSWNAPEIYSVQPIAVVAGQETTITVRGHNLAAPGTKILCAYRGKYTSKEILPEDNANLRHSESILVEDRLQRLQFFGGPPNVLGRCFIEVEHGFKGDSFPVIVADPPICRELQCLECEMEEFWEDKGCSTVNEHSHDHLQDYVRVRAREEVINFLNELGWLFQRSSRLQGGVSFMNDPDSFKFSPARFKSLLIFAVERDWSALLKKLLDLFFGMNVGKEGTIQELSEILSEVNLLHRAVKRNCKQMVEFLLYYTTSSLNGSVPSRNQFIFTPDLAGPGGLTPLHLAASIQNSEDLVDTLTSDPQEIGLQSWNSALDSSGHTPHAYASMRNNHSYNRLVGRKLADKRSAQVSITIYNTEASLDEAVEQRNSKELPRLPLQKLPQTCAQCMSMSNRKLRKISGSQGVLYRPYVHSVLAIAAVCVCVCLLFKGPPQIGSVAPFKWENILYGSI